MFLVKLSSNFKAARLRIWQWLWAHLAIVLLYGLRLFPARLSIKLCGLLAQIIGPFSSRHKLILRNLSLAYPNYSEKQRQMLAHNMWWHMGALFAEYIFLEKIACNQDAILVENAEILHKITNSKRPIIFFTAHIGNFEFLPILAARFKLNITVLFRPPNNKYIAELLFKKRNQLMPNLIAASPISIWQLSNILANKGNIGLLVDQKLPNGVRTRFFNEPTKTNPLAIKLARQYNCDIYPVRCTRLASGKYKITFHEQLCLSRELDITAACQLLNDMVEKWVRDTPEQWMWFHDRWRY